MHVYQCAGVLEVLQLQNCPPPQRRQRGRRLDQQNIRPVACQEMRERAFGDLGDKVIVKPTGFGWRAGVIGAAALALMDLFYQRTDEKL